MTYYGSTTATNGDNTDGRNTPLLMQQQRDQNFLLAITQEIKKSVNESLEGVVGDLRKQVTDLQSEVVSLQQSSTGSRSPFKQPRLPKVLTVMVYIMCTCTKCLYCIILQSTVKKFHETEENQFDPSKL